MSSQEEESAPPRTEAKILAEFGYDHCLNTPLTHPDGSNIIGQDGSVITGSRFLDTYKDPEKRQHTKDMLDGFLIMSLDDPDYADAWDYIASYLRAYFGEPKHSAD